MALKITGGQRTDELLGKNGSGPEGLPHSIIVTPDGIEGEVPVVTANGAVAPEAPVAVVAAAEETPPKTATGKTRQKKNARREVSKHKSRRSAGRRRT